MSKEHFYEKLKKVYRAVTKDVAEAIEGFHRQIRKVTKTKGTFINDVPSKAGLSGYQEY